MITCAGSCSTTRRQLRSTGYWSELHYVSHDALKLVDAFEQLWQFATQDADPSAFTPMRETDQAARGGVQKTTRRHPAEATWTACWNLPAAHTVDRSPASKRMSCAGCNRKLCEQELPHEAAIRLTLARVLVAPHFSTAPRNPGRATSRAGE